MNFPGMGELFLDKDKLVMVDNADEAVEINKKGGITWNEPVGGEENFSGG